jgi:hypothetical protein
MAAALFSNDVAFDPPTDDNEFFVSRELRGNQVRRRGAMGNAIAESLSGFIGN